MLLGRGTGLTVAAWFSGSRDKLDSFDWEFLTGERGKDPFADAEPADNLGTPF